MLNPEWWKWHRSQRGESVSKRLISETLRVLRSTGVEHRGVRETRAALSAQVTLSNTHSITEIQSIRTGQEG